MLLAAGVKPQTQEEYEIVPFIIDPHKANKDLIRTTDLLGKYQAITDEIGLKCGFFSTKITTLDKIKKSENPLSNSFTFKLQQVDNTEFRNYIDYDEMDKSNQALTNILFSGKSVAKDNQKINLLDIEMDIGFVGNPNVGSVVLNQVKDSAEFREFASVFNEKDRIFIISSIFGGTGAAGFPTILKNIRDAARNGNIDSKDLLENAKIGAITVLPYFNVEKDESSPIQKSDFIAKTKSALYYYKDNVTGNNSVNSLYYITDDYSGTPYENDPGDGGQKNPAHFIELASALAVIDFLETPDGGIVTQNGRAENPTYKEFALKSDSGEIEFSDFEVETEQKIALRLSQLVLFKKFLNERLDDSVGKHPWSMKPPELDRTFFNDTFYRAQLGIFLDSFIEWLDEMSDNRRGFSPFNLRENLETFIKGKKIHKGLFGFGGLDYNAFDSKLSSEERNNNYGSNKSVKLVDLFFKTTEKTLTKKFNLKN